MNIPHSWVGVALSLYEEAAATVPKLYRRIHGIEGGAAGGCAPPCAYIAIEENKI